MTLYIMSSNLPRCEPCFHHSDSSIAACYSTVLLVVRLVLYKVLLPRFININVKEEKSSRVHVVSSRGLPLALLG